eukprot:scaffold173763_cov18-Tisochrysis_lutea.AAC.1
MQDNFFKVDLSSLYGSAVDGYFSQHKVLTMDEMATVQHMIPHILDVSSPASFSVSLEGKGKIASVMDCLKTSTDQLHREAVHGDTDLHVVVDAFDTNVLVSDPASKILDLGTCTAEDLQDVVIPLDLE